MLFVGVEIQRWRGQQIRKCGEALFELGVAQRSGQLTADIGTRVAYRTDLVFIGYVDGHADLRIVLATPETADQLCAPLDTGGPLSCRNGEDVVVNAWRWQFGADSYPGDLTGYRRYVVNHETGHALGYPHVSCPGSGQMAPVMLQQTKGLEGCEPNPWPARVDLLGH